MINNPTYQVTIFIYMEKTKLLSILKRSYQPQYKNKSPFECLNLFKTEVPFTIYADKMEAIDMVLFSFILPQTELVSDLSKLYDEIRFNLFAYSYFEIMNEDVYVSCNSCGGDGRLDCDDCDFIGNIDCPYCEGTGEVEEEDLREIYQYTFVCYNQKIIDSLLYKEEFEILSDDTANILMNNKKTLLINVKKSNTEILWGEGDANDNLFVSVSEEPTLYKSGSNIDVREIPDIG